MANPELFGIGDATDTSAPKNVRLNNTMLTHNSSLLILTIHKKTGRLIAVRGFLVGPAPVILPGAGWR